MILRVQKKSSENVLSNLEKSELCNIFAGSIADPDTQWLPIDPDDPNIVPVNPTDPPPPILLT